MLLEVCANSAQSAKNAQLGGAQRVELCQNLNEGGTTPSFSAIEYCVNQLQINTFVLIRPRAGHFCYNAAEIITRTQVDEIHASCKYTVSQYGENFVETDINEVGAILEQIQGF